MTPTPASPSTSTHAIRSHDIDSLQPDRDARGFAVAVTSDREGVVHVCLVGSLHLATCTLLVEGLAALREPNTYPLPTPTCRTVTLHLDELEVLDADGLTALEECRDALSRRGWRVQPGLLG